MTKRTTNILTNVEYLPQHKNRTTDILVNVEYKPVHKVRTTCAAVMVEYSVPTPPATGRTFGPAIGMG